MSYENINPQKFKELIETEDHVMLDVRTSQELAEGLIRGHVKISFFGSDFKDELEKQDKEKAYLLYCRSGNRSGQACTLMSNPGVEKLYNPEGGIKAWNETFGG